MPGEGIVFKDLRSRTRAIERPLPPGLGLGWLVAGILTLLTLHSKGHGGDLRFWQSWMGSLQTGGYEALNANYPPILLHWIAMGGALFGALGLGEATPLLVKMWVQLPIWLTWMFLLYQVAQALVERGVPPATSGVFWLVVINPAILLDGPVWGQVDLLPWLPLSLGLMAHERGRHWQGPVWFCVGLAIKFQSIVFAPIFAALFLRAVYADRKALWGVVGAAGVMVLSFLPFILVGKGWSQAGQAYWSNVGRYSKATFNAANLWRLLVPDGARGSDPLPGLDAVPWVAPINLGLVLFGGISILVFVAVLRQRSNVWALGVLAMFGFFAFSAEMHERYLFMAIPMAAMWAAREDRGRPWLVAATAFVALNIALVLFPRGLYEWAVLSLLVVVAVPFLLLHVFERHWTPAVNALVDVRPRRAALFAAFLPVLLLVHEIQTDIHGRTFDLRVGEHRAMARWIPSSQKQDWGEPRRRYSFWHLPLRYFDRNVHTGIAVHAESRLEYSLPPGRYRLHGYYGPATAASIASDMRFEIRLDEEVVWASPSVERRTPSTRFAVEVEGPGELVLFVDPNGANEGDHALWGDVKIQRLE